MANPPINPDTRVAFCPLVIRQEGGDYLIGREDIAEYLEVPEIGVEIIHALNGGETIETLARRLSEKYKQEVPVADFVDSMIENRMVHMLDGVVIEELQQARDHLKGWRLERLSWLFSKTAFWVYGAMALLIVASFIVFPRYFPKSNDFFPFHSYAASLLTNLVLMTLTVMIHELSHLAAARSIGVGGRFSLSHRLIFLVAQTDITNVWSRPARERYKPYLAGMAADTVQTFLWVALLIARDRLGAPIPIALYLIAKQSILRLVFWSLLWQFRFYMQTDIYYVVTNFLGCRNLIADARQYLLSLCKRLILQKPGWTPPNDRRERRIIKWYSVFYLFGVAITLCVFAGYTVPILLRGGLGSIKSLMAGYRAAPAAFADGIVFLLLAVLQYGTLSIVAGRRYWAALLRRLRHEEPGSPVIPGASGDIHESRPDRPSTPRIGETP